MSSLSIRLGVVLISTLLSTLLLAALCLGTRTAHAQATPVTYWIPSWPLGFGGDLTDGAGPNTYGNFPSFDRSGARSGFSPMRYNFPNGWFIGAESGAMGLNVNRDGAFGTARSLHYEGVQFGYNFQTVGNLPVTVYAGFNTLKYSAGIGDPFASFDSRSSTLPGYSVNAGIEFQPASNLSLSLGVGYTQQPGRINSLGLPGTSPSGFGDHR